MDKWEKERIQRNKENPYRVFTGHLLTKDKNDVVDEFPLLKDMRTDRFVHMDKSWLTYDEVVNHYIEYYMDEYTRKNMTKGDRDDFDEKWIESEQFWIQSYGVHLKDNPYHPTYTSSVDVTLYDIEFLKAVYDRLGQLEQNLFYDKSIKKQQHPRMVRYYMDTKVRGSNNDEAGYRKYIDYLRQNEKNKGMSDEDIIRIGYK